MAYRSAFLRLPRCGLRTSPKMPSIILNLGMNLPNQSCPQDSVGRIEPLPLQESSYMTRPLACYNIDHTSQSQITATKERLAPNNQQTAFPCNNHIMPSTPATGASQRSGPIKIRPYIYTDLEADRLCLRLKRYIQHVVFGDEIVDWKSIAVIDETNEPEIAEDLQKALHLWSSYQNEV